MFVSGVRDNSRSQIALHASAGRRFFFVLGIGADARIPRRLRTQLFVETGPVHLRYEDQMSSKYAWLCRSARGVQSAGHRTLAYVSRATEVGRRVAHLGETQRDPIAAHTRGTFLTTRPKTFTTCAIFFSDTNFFEK